MQGALDGGLDIPHNQKRFVGYDPDAKEYDADTMRKYIFGGHVAEYMMEMEEEEPEKFQAHFKNYIDNEVEADEEAIEELYAGVGILHLCSQHSFIYLLCAGPLPPHSGTPLPVLMRTDADQTYRCMRRSVRPRSWTRRSAPLPLKRAPHGLASLAN